jgi:hypothetical protein
VARYIPGNRRTALLARADIGAEGRKPAAWRLGEGPKPRRMIEFVASPHVRAALAGPDGLRAEQVPDQDAGREREEWVLLGPVEDSTTDRRLGADPRDDRQIVERQDHDDDREEMVRDAGHRGPRTRGMMGNPSARTAKESLGVVLDRDRLSRSGPDHGTGTATRASTAFGGVESP